MQLLTGRDPIVTCSFFDIKSNRELSAFFCIRHNHLMMLAYASNVKRYTSFSIVKRNGKEFRTISAPRHDLKRIQQLIADELAKTYNAPKCVNGFVKDRSIANNAINHTKKVSVLNIDLKDFFPSISAARVRGLFIKYYNFPKEVADTLTNLVCHDGRLPQGAPSSPIISNVICFPLDKALMNFASKNKCTYTRYADDLVFSTTSKYKSSSLFNQDLIKDDNSSNAIKRIIEKNGFTINQSKIHVANKGSRQLVNGIVVNEKCNMPRSEYRALRVALNNWKQYGIEKAASCYASFYPEYSGRLFDNDMVLADRFHWHIRGRLDYYTMVDSVNSVPSEPLTKLWTMYRNLCPEETVPYIPAKEYAYRTEGPILSDKETLPNCEYSEGSAFFVHSFLFTCKHCVEALDKDISKETQLYQITNGVAEITNVTCNAFKFNHLFDFAWAEVPATDCSKLYSAKCNLKYRVQMGETITAIGFPGGLRTPELIKAKVIETHSSDNNVRVDHAFIHGMSGGPVFNNRMEIIGMIVKGGESGAYTREGEFIPLHLLSGYEPFTNMHLD